MRPFKFVSVWALLAAVVLFLLQVFPIPGVILMMFGAAFLNGLLVHVFLVALGVEALFRRVPRPLIAVPIAVYGAYYGLYFEQWRQIEAKAAELRASNPALVLVFDPDKQSLVTEHATSLVEGYEIPVAYEANPNYKPEEHLSYRLIRRDQCNVPKDSQARVQTYGVHFNRVFQQGVCLLRFPEAPDRTVIIAKKRGDLEIWKHKYEIGGETTDLIVDGNVIASYRTASVWRLPFLPMGYIGCALISSTPAWKCGADFIRMHTFLDVMPDRVDRNRLGPDPLSVMLGLRKYTAQDLAGFKGFPLNAAALQRVGREQARVEDDVFGVLQAIVDGKNPRPTFNMGYSISLNPSRLAPVAEAMAKRLLELSEPEAKGQPNREDQIRALAAGLAALPREAFARVSDQAFAAIQAENSWNRSPVLYLRAADAGPKTLAFYKRDFIGGKLPPFLKPLPVLAICRIGQADDEIVAEMKARFSAPPDRYDQDLYRSALTVALIKLGEGQFVRDQLAVVPADPHGWREAVLDKRGVTETGPNNCMMERWNTTDFLPPIMAASLQWRGSEWVAQPAP